MGYELQGAAIGFNAHIVFAGALFVAYWSLAGLFALVARRLSR